jgi:hypothetical protein
VSELTYGQKAVGLTFNPSGDPMVTRLKELYAEIIDILNGVRSDIHTGHPARHEKVRLFSVAITEAQAAQMWAVKAQTWRD